MTTIQNTTAVRVWDLPTRLFHLLFGLCVAGLIATGEIGGPAMTVHFWLGYSALSLLLFRLVWGIVGGHWSRFVNFIPSPSSLFLYLSNAAHPSRTEPVGHNPLGALSVVTMLGLVLLQIFSGFMSDDDISVSGPWSTWVPSSWVELATQYHTEVGKILLFALLALHIGSVLFYKYFQSNDLITPMVTGDKDLPASTHPSRDTGSSRLFALSVLAGCAYVVYRLVQLGG